MKYVFQVSIEVDTSAYWKSKRKDFCTKAVAMEAVQSLLSIAKGDCSNLYPLTMNPKVQSIKEINK